MAICKPAKAIKVRVPRQNAQRLGPSLTAQLRSLGKKEKINLQLLPPVQEQPGGAGASTENASEWNSLLLSARAQRGPFWDISTQQFLVDKESELFYDPTTILEACKPLNPSTQQDTKAGVSGSSSSTAQQQQQQQQPLPPAQHPHTQQMQAQQRPGYGVPQYSGGYPNMPGSMGPPTTPARPGGMMPGSYPGTPAGATPGQYYGDGMSPMRPGPGAGPGMIDMGASPDVYGRRITRGMSDGFGGFGS